MTRVDIINKLISHHNYKAYLEIGTHSGGTFQHVVCEKKYGVEPFNHTPSLDVLRMDSDAFFAKNRLVFKKTFDIIFLDGLHQWEQTLRDIYHSLQVLHSGGTIVVHDCNPVHEDYQVRSPERDGVIWTGDVWKALAILRASYPGLKISVVDTDYGCGIIQRGEQEAYITGGLEDLLSWTYFDLHRKEILDLISVAEFELRYISYFAEVE